MVREGSSGGVAFEQKPARLESAMWIAEERAGEAERIAGVSHHARLRLGFFKEQERSHCG